MRRGGGDSSRLRERFGQDHSRNKRVSRKMSGEHRIIVREMRFAFCRSTGFALDQLPDEDKRRSMRQAEEVISDQ